MNRKELTSRVLHLLDEVGLTDYPIDNSMPIVSHINSSLEDSVIRLLDIAPIHYLPAYDMTQQPIMTQQNGVVIMDIPKDYLKLVDIRLNSWHKTVRGAIQEGDPIYSQQFSKVTRGKPNNPIAAEVIRGGKRQLELYSVLPMQRSVTVTSAKYIKDITAEDEKGRNIYLRSDEVVIHKSLEELLSLIVAQNVAISLSMSNVELLSNKINQKLIELNNG